MKRLLVIGIGAGDPDHLTLPAVKAISATDVFLTVDKGEVKHELVQLRLDLIAADGRAPYRIAEARDPERDRTTAPAYTAAVEDWRSRRALACEALIRHELRDGLSGAFLVWGDPGVYDSTLAIVEEILQRGNVTFDYKVIPGISSMAALTARHRTGLTQVGRPVHLTTGRRLAEHGPTADDVLVILDAHCSFAGLKVERGVGRTSRCPHSEVRGLRRVAPSNAPCAGLRGGGARRAGPGYAGVRGAGPEGGGTRRAGPGYAGARLAGLRGGGARAFATLAGRAGPAGQVLRGYCRRSRREVLA
ncbi:precorrin-6A synthase (deacetylating) [Nonomuraea jabiensis]|uniref:precorrin-6A synthase (deacetylating) n=1 Tax=Nonomuraea jabiensis TaxID=882448 RepID=UPI0034488517